MKKLNTMFVFMVLIGLLMFLLASCQSKSGLRQATPDEKCVILSDTTLTRGDGKDMISTTRYRVKRIEQGVIDIIYQAGFPNYQEGDTIFHDFIN